MNAAVQVVPKPVIEIYKATPFDASRLARFLVEWLDVTAVEFPKAIPEELVLWVLKTVNTGYVAVAKKSGRIVGISGISPTTFQWNSRAVCLKSEFFYVPPAVRGAGVADKLMQATQAFAASVNLPLYMEVTSGADERTDRWYSMKGGRYLGGTYAYGAKARVE